MRNILLAILLAAPSFAAAPRIGDALPNKCWTDRAGKKVCLSDHDGKVRVILHNAGWCGPCNQEFKTLPKEMEVFAGKSVVFLSASCEGWTSKSSPDEKFLEEWAAKHSLDKAKASFVVLASPKDCGRDYWPGGSPSIPNVVIVDPSGHLNWRGVAPTSKKLTQEINYALSPP